MIRVFIAVGVLAFGIETALPQNLDVIKDRRQTMKGVGDATALNIKMLKNQAPFDLAVVQASLNTFIAAAKKMPTLFPDDSKTGGDTKALPEIWANKPDLVARYGKFGQDAAAALAAIKDQATFTASFPAVLKNCGGCHEKYRASEN